jgi:O-succinylbenzoate synthase
VTYVFESRRYRIPFRRPVRTAHGLWTEREGLWIRLTDEDGRVTYGEAAPIPGFGTERVDELEEACRQLGDRVTAAQLEAVPAAMATLRHAFATALKPVPESAHKFLTVAALLPAGRAAIAEAGARAEIGFRTFKWKVGVGDIAEELSLFDDLCGILPEGSRLRLDANGAWDRRRAERWLERCAERPVEFVEQPALGQMSDGETGRRRADDLLRGLAEAYPTPIALDESLVGDGDVAHWLESGWPGIYVLKPALIADVAATLARLEKAGAEVVFSSALETAIGARSALRTAFGWRGPQKSEVPPRALGFGVWPLFDSAACDGPTATPYFRREDVERINVEAAWNAVN